MTARTAIPMATRRAVARRIAEGEPERHPIACAYCGEPGSFYWPRTSSGRPGAWVHFTLELDHVQPLASGGSHDPANVVPACRSCNRRKGSR